MSCLLGYVQNRRTAGHLKAGNITSLFRTWYVVFTTDVVMYLTGIIHVTGLAARIRERRQLLVRRLEENTLKTETSMEDKHSKWVIRMCVWTGCIWLRWCSRLVNVEMGENICVFFFCVRRLGTWTVRQASVYKGLCLVSWELPSTECVGLQSGFERRRVSGSNLTITYIRAVLCQLSGTLWLLRTWK